MSTKEYVRPTDIEKTANQALLKVKADPCCICGYEGICGIKYKGVCKVARLLRIKVQRAVEMEARR